MGGRTILDKMITEVSDLQWNILSGEDMEMNIKNSAPLTCETPIKVPIGEQSMP